jgi:hypothetical protein
MIWEALLRGEGLTALEALQRFGCGRLAARIRDIRDAVHDRWDENSQSYQIVESTMVTLAEGKRVAQYRLSKSYLALMRGETRDLAVRSAPHPLTRAIEPRLEGMPTGGKPN